MLDRRFVLVSGKGGVGKSAVAAALGIVAARHGRRVLAIAMTEPLGLASHLGIETLSAKPVQVHPGLFASVVDRANALDQYLKLQMRGVLSLPTGQLSKALSVLVDTAPGVREIVTMGKPIFEVWEGGWDLVIADAPPLGQLQSYLTAPQTITGLIPTGAVREQAANLQAALGDPELSGLVLVTTPEELPIVETRQAIAQIDKERQILIAGVLANRVFEPLDTPRATIEQLDPSPARDAGLLHSDLTERQREWLDAVPDDPRLPYLFDMRTPAEVAERLADECEQLL
jgi:anion-transporting  ArsA/GET3 family ATPase